MASEGDSKASGITLFPDDSNFPIVESFQPDGQETLCEEFSEAQVFGNVVVQLEKRRQKAKSNASRSDLDEYGASKRLKMEGLEGSESPDSVANPEASSTTPPTDKINGSDENEESIDPRVYYQPMVLELQAAVVELYQLVNTVDLVRPSKAPTKEPRYLEEVYCMRDDSNLQVNKEDLAYLLTSKSTQVGEAAETLLNGAKSLQAAIAKERIFFKGVRNLLGKWKICAPLHGTISRPFRAGEGLAVDCSYISAGSNFTPQAMPISSVAFAELSRTKSGFVKVKQPEFYLKRTIKVALESLSSFTKGFFTIPRPKGNDIKRNGEQFSGDVDDATFLDEQNENLLSDVQHSIFCEEAFQTIMNEALLPSAKWVDSIHHLANYLGDDTKKKKSPPNLPLSILSIRDDEVRLRIDENHLLSISLVGYESSPAEDESPSTRDAFLESTCEYAMSLLQQEIRSYHAYCKQQRQSAIDLIQSKSQAPDPRVLHSLVNVLSHNLLKDQIATFLDEIASKLAVQHGAGNVIRVLDDCLCQPFCDTVRGVFIMTRWKICQRSSSLSTFDIYVGKNFATEILIQGTRILYDDASLNRRDICGMDGFRALIFSIISKQLAECLYEDAVALGMNKASIDNDHLTVRIVAPGEWDGTFVGEGKVPDELNVGCVILQPSVMPDGKASVCCYVQAIYVANVKAYIISESDNTAAIDWGSLPGHSDSSKLLWLLRNLGLISDSK
ncbi:unnamed protein product [Aphanomyces euteiches]|uniref:Mediator of RNA polymerase II transcription subunit 17 n=1 Tax=Aphanomyces euteiches TaxID=100861 RepID=A0A6G0WLP6_9STRA|nr:hypothetical protein Ae201684_014036 [Aphanomyces euteiches]KAH9152604.1 hypothetical protein AeRB84_004987 [Aphanomyces euteiches]